MTQRNLAGSTYLQPVPGVGSVTLGTLTGTRTVAQDGAALFYEIAEEFQAPNINLPSEPSEGAVIATFDATENVDDTITYRQIFQSLAGDPSRVRLLALDQDQMLAFIEQHPDKVLQEDGATVFLLLVQRKLFVAIVHSYYEGAYAVSIEEYVDGIWDMMPGDRFVVIDAEL